MYVHATDPVLYSGEEFWPSCRRRGADTRCSRLQRPRSIQPRYGDSRHSTNESQRGHEQYVEKEQAERLHEFPNLHLRHYKPEHVPARSYLPRRERGADELQRRERSE